MSYTELFKFNTDGTADGLADIKNAWRGAMTIWRILEERHLPSLSKPLWAYDGEIDYWSRTTLPHFDDGKPNPMKAIWRLFDDDKLTINEKIVLGSTFDNVVIKKENLQKVIEAFKEFDEKTSLKEQAEVFETLLTDDTVIAVAFNQTSVIGDNWTNFHYNKETEESEPYNLLKDDKHWFLFSELSAGKKEKDA